MSLIKEVSNIKEKEESPAKEEEYKRKRNSLLGTIIAETPAPPSPGDLVEGKVLDIAKNSVYVDLPPFGTGIIYGKEYNAARDIIRNINPGDSISGKIVDIEENEGYFEISLKEARQAKVWAEAEEAIKSKIVLELPVQEANKGGLMMTWQGIVGFLPASQLNTEHYPRVLDGDKDKILEELKKLVGEKLSVSIIGASPKENKLIFSEKSPELKNKIKIIERYAVGDEVTGEVTGVVDFGIFVKIEEGLEGLVHISEIDWGLVENPKTIYKPGDQIKAIIIEIKEGRISLSVKTLKKNPWLVAEKKYKQGDSVKAVVIKFNKYGALASIEEGVAGLVHVSEFGNEVDLRDKLSLGQSYDFKITLFEPKEHKMTLSFMEANPSAKSEKEKSEKPSESKTEEPASTT
jgi:small subunit ribosomal protein S1